MDSKKVYTLLIENNYRFEFNNLSEYWYRKANIDDIDWQIIFKNISKITILNKIKNFSFRFVHKIIYSDLKLYHSNIRNSSLCTFCSKDIGDFIHNYGRCYEVQAFIANAMQWYNQSMNSNLKLDIKIYLLGSHNLNR